MLTNVNLFWRYRGPKWTARPRVQNRPPAELPTYRLCPFAASALEALESTCHDCLDKTCEQFRAIGLNDEGKPLPWLARPECHAKTRHGAPCKNKVHPGKHRCRLHGGASTGPKTQAGKARIAAAQRLRWDKWRLRNNR